MQRADVGEAREAVAAAVGLRDILDADGHRTLSRMGQPANLLIGTPAYGGQVHVDYVSSLLVFQRQGIVFTLMTSGHESLITRARNTIISTFH
jgi:hypothetical protein